MAKSKNSSPRWRRRTQTRGRFHQFFAEWKNWSWIFHRVLCWKLTCRPWRETMPLNIWPFIRRRPILSAYNAFEKKICQHWVNTVVWCGSGLEVEGDISLRPSVFTPLIPEKKFTSVRKVLGDLASSQTCSVYRSPLPQPHGGAANSWECLARGLCMCAPR